ncbi:hypothetical protein RRG08_013659 [Elysia crispata]|uniref:Retrovirus-related Pol polyprotein from transposon TNT 1-94-like beta-barrel domain-containing protein n=1 Tax=Elysia crispata TaxID=231223 RepID=A0AAE1A1U8_9GAST|nr:hypothetical protein RRG08_013659 [Elysia crispata]
MTNSTNRASNQKPKRWCSNCKMNNHDTEYCRRISQNPSLPASKKKGRWCDVCRSNTHDTRYCRKLTKLRQVKCDEQEDKDHESHFVFGLDTVSRTQDQQSSDAFLVDSGATVHVITDKTRFIRFNNHFNPANHIIELADGTKCNNLAMGQGDAKVSLTDTNGCQQNIILKNALYVPSFSQNIFSVLAATDNGASVQFGKSSAQLQFHGTAFDIFKDGQLYFLKSSFVSKTSSHTLQEWHIILGHCNKADILKLENSVDGMIITDKSDFDCEVCALGKMTDNRSRKPDETAKQPLDVVHIDLAGPVEPEDTNGMKYSLVCVDSCTNITSVYFIKQKSEQFKHSSNILLTFPLMGR